MSVAAATVQKLRAATGAGMMECKKALVESGGDVEKAKDLLRIKSGAKADKVAGRGASEGRVAFARQGGAAVLVEVNCETDFVGRGAPFAKFCGELAAAMAAANVDSPDKAVFADGRGGEETRRELVMQVGENVSFGRAEVLQAEGEVACYMHTGDKIAAVADYRGSEEAAREVCMHIAAMRPAHLTLESVPEAEREKEKALLSAQAAESGKPAAVVEKMIVGRLHKHFAERVLLLQPFVKDESQTVGDFLRAANTEILAFTRLAVGE